MSTRSGMMLALVLCGLALTQGRANAGGDGTDASEAPLTWKPAFESTLFLLPPKAEVQVSLERSVGDWQIGPALFAAGLQSGHSGWDVGLLLHARYRLSHLVALRLAAGPGRTWDSNDHQYSAFGRIGFDVNDMIGLSVEGRMRLYDPSGHKNFGNGVSVGAVGRGYVGVIVAVVDALVFGLLIRSGPA